MNTHKWVADVLDKIIQPYDLRYFWNRNMPYFLNHREAIELFFQRLTQLSARYRDYPLEAESLDHLKDDIEDIVFRHENRLPLFGTTANIEPSPKKIPRVSKRYRDEFSFLEDANLLKQQNTSKKLTIEITDEHPTGLMLEAERILLVHAIKSCHTIGDRAKMLGWSERTVRNKIKKLKEGYYDVAH